MFSLRHTFSGLSGEGASAILAHDTDTGTKTAALKTLLPIKIHRCRLGKK